MYCRTNLDHIVPKVVFQNPVNIKSAFSVNDDDDDDDDNADENSGANLSLQMSQLSVDDLPKKGDIVAIDAEFVLLEQSQSARQQQLMFSLGWSSEKATTSLSLTNTLPCPRLKGCSIT